MAYLADLDDVHSHVGHVLFTSRCKAVYGLLSMPFVIFLLPGLGAALTHARPTGCVIVMTIFTHRNERMGVDQATLMHM